MNADTLTVADLLEHFKSIYGTEPDPSNVPPQDPSLHEDQPNAMLDGEISQNELKRLYFLRKITKVRAQTFYVPSCLNHHSRLFVRFY